MLSVVGVVTPDQSGHSTRIYFSSGPTIFHEKFPFHLWGKTCYDPNAYFSR